MQDKARTASAVDHASHLHPRKQIMKANLGSLDRALRVGAGVVLIGLAMAGVIGFWGYLGIVPLLTGLVSFCPLYSLLGLNSRPHGV